MWSVFNRSPLPLPTKWKGAEKKEKCWAREWLLLRQDKGAYNCILTELRLRDQEDFRKFLRMNTETFQELLQKVGPHITKQTTRMRIPISPEEKLAVTLRFLATGESYDSLMWQFRIHNRTIARFVPTVCTAIYECLKDDYLKMPDTEGEWLDIAKQTFDYWNFPNAIGAADGKHVSLYHPKNSGSEYYNYKGFYSLVMLALVDFDYKFIFVDVGCQGRISDGGVFNNSALSYAFERGTLNLPSPRCLPAIDESWIEEENDSELVPFVMVADDAFPLTKHIMKPYGQRNLDDEKRIFNYRTSRLRRTSENTFGIWACRFRIFLSRIYLAPEVATNIVLASVVLHNMLRTMSKDSYSPPEMFHEDINFQTIRPGSWREDGAVNVLMPLPKGKNNRHAKTAEEVRSCFTNYFYGKGQVPWQWGRLI